MRWLVAGAGAAASVFLAVPLIRYLVGPLRLPPVDWWPLGPVSKFPVNQTRFTTFDNPIRQPWDGMTAHTGVYVRNLGQGDDGQERFLVFAVNCAHLGCPVEWFPQSGLFMCPCHGDDGRGGERAGAVHDRAFLALISDQALRRIIITGRLDLGMPVYNDSDYRSPDFKPLTSEQIQDLVALLGRWRVGASPNGK